MKALITGVLFFTSVSLSYAETVPSKGTVDTRIRNVLYNEDEVYRLHGWVGQEIHIEFERGELFVAMSGGDLNALTIGSERNSLSLKPRVPLVDSNYTIITTARYYHIAYSAGIQRRFTDSKESIYSLRFTYPGQEIDARLRTAQQVDALLDSQGGSGPRNVDYWFCGKQALKPIEASDDGMQTRLRFDERTEWPAVFVRDEEGKEALVNFNVRGRELIIHRIAKEFVLRRGRLVGCVVNRGFHVGAPPVDSQTISPQVRRETRGANHE